MAALGRQACPLSLAPLAKAGLRLPASASLPLASCWPRPQQLLPVSATGGGRRRCPQRGSPWQAGPLPTGRLSPDMAQKGGPCYRGQRLLDKRTLSSCCEPGQRSTTVSEKIRLCSFRVGLPGTPEAPPLGELSPKVTERARTLTERNRRSDSIALSKNLLIAVRRLSGDGLALSVIACAMPPLPKGEAFASRKACPLCQWLSLWESCHRR